MSCHSGPPIYQRKMKKMFPIIFLLLYVSLVYSDSHSLRYYYTGVSAPGSGLPEFSIVGYVDDREIVNYNSESGRMKPKVKWMEKVEPEYWEEETQKQKPAEPVFRYNVRTLMSRFNQTGGFHIVQEMYGCERRDDGSITGYDQHGYDGGEFMSLDTQTWTYIPTMSEAQITAQRWNSPEEQVGERNKNYLENICVEWLQKYVENGREDLERRDQTAMDTARSSSESYENEVNISSLQVKQTAEPNGHDANVKSKEASSSDQIEKMDIQSCVDSQTEIFGSIEALQKAISYFEETTKSNFIVLQKTRSFGNEDWKPAGSEKILWKSPNSEAVTPISFTGVPYVVVGRKSLQCHLGKNFAHSNKHEKSEKQVQDHVFQKHRRLIQHTKKMGCLAEIHILHIIRFPGFEVNLFM